MKTTERTSVKVYVVAFILIYLVMMLVAIKVLNYYNAKEIHEQLTTAFDSVDKSMAIKHLSELRGMILEVKSLAHEDLPEGILYEELDDITNTNSFANPYLKDFAFVIPNTSSIEALCDELISQIDYQIHIIEYGTKRGDSPLFFMLIFYRCIYRFSLFLFNLHIINYELM